MRPSPNHPMLDLDRATVGRIKHAGSMKGRPHRVTLDRVPYTSPFYEVTLQGKVIGLNNFTSPPGCALVHVQEEGFPIVLTPGTKITMPEPFAKFFVQLPQVSDGWAITVPQDAARYFLFDVAERPEDLVYGPVPPYLQGADGGNPKTTRVALSNAVGPALQLVGSNSLRKGVRIYNWDAAISMAYGYTNGVTFASGASRGMEVQPKTGTVVLPTTGPIFAVAGAAGPIDVVVEELI